MKLLFLQGESNNDVLGRFTQSLSSAFTQFGQADVFALTRDLPLVTQLSHLIGQLLDNRYDAIVSFNALGADFWFPIDGKRMNVLALANIPHICWMVDDPIYHIERLAVPNPKRSVIFTSRQHTTLAQNFNFTGRFYQQLVSSSIQDEFVPHQDRRYDVAVAASWMGEPKPFWQNYPFRLQEITHKLLAVMASQAGYSAYLALVSLAEKEEFVFDSEQEMQTLLIDTHSYYRQLMRIQLIEDVIHSGLDVAVIGSGWEGRLGDYPNVSCLSSVSYEDILSYYQQARVVINLNAENGACERVFDGIASGAMIFSEFSHALHDIFSEENGVIFYDKNKRDDSIMMISNLIHHQQTESMSQKAQNILLNAHQWKNRAEFLCDLLT
jgi:hypothetical protein